MNTELETNLVSVERVVQYTKLPQEEEDFVEPRPPISWPDQGSIEFKDLQIRYREDLPLVLQGINAYIKPREKIGVVGRTGAGKSSLMMALFRIVEPSYGTIVIDNYDIRNVGLHDIRSRLAIIPQDPTLFTGTIRSNLDPFSEHTDLELWDCIEAVSIREQVDEMEGQLDAPVTEFGNNLSVGTRQLMCLARALLRRPKILILDEATASIDYTTDKIIQETIREKFKDITVLTIAHRVTTIMDSDRILVLDKGQIAEFDSPQELLKNQDSIFYRLVSDSQSMVHEDEKTIN